MCTVTLVPMPGGFRLIANRDERRSRQSALGPRAHAAGSRRAVFPVDAAAGGSWVGVNDRGLAVALLNRYAAPADPLRAVPDGAGAPLASEPGRITRGALVPLLLACSDMPSALASAWTIDRRRFAPFRLVLAHRAGAALITSAPDRWSVRALPLDAPLMFTSSALGDAHVDAPRRRLFTRLMAAGWADGQRAFHRHRWPLRPDISVVMARPDARTVSRTTVDCGGRGPALSYEPLLEVRRHPATCEPDA